MVICENSLEVPSLILGVITMSEELQVEFALPGIAVLSNGSVNF